MSPRPLERFPGSAGFAPRSLVGECRDLRVKPLTIPYGFGGDADTTSVVMAIKCKQMTATEPTVPTKVPFIRRVIIISVAVVVVREKNEHGECGTAMNR